MPPSQLKALKTRLREKGITAPTKSTPQRKSGGSHANPKDRHTALQQIRDDFNPFELRHTSARPAKFPSTSIHNSAGSGKYAKVLHRPGVSKSAGEEMRRRQLLPEMRRRNKTGGLVDRRIGEGDEGMTAEERAVARFAREKEGKKGGVFDLEGSDDEGGGGLMGLTHGGRVIDELEDDDMGGAGEGSGSEDEDEDVGFLVRKRRREDEDDEVEEANIGQPDVKKTKKEVMQEVIAKSKLHKYERQKVKEDDEDLIDELDAGMADLLPLLRSQPAPPPPKPIETQSETTAIGNDMKMDPERQKLLDGMDRAQADKEYEKRLRELAQDTRAKPSERSKTAEEKAKEEAERLKDLEERREKRMRGEQVSDDEDGQERGAVDVGAAEGNAVDPLGNEEVVDDAEEFGFASAVAEPKGKVKEKVQHVDEDEFDFDVDLVASASEAELSDGESDADDASVAEETTQANQERDEEDEFVKGILGGANATPIADPNTRTKTPNEGGTLAFTYPCPRSHTELLSIVDSLPLQQLSTVIQRIRALYHPSLSATNKDMLSDFSRALVDHLAYMAEHDQPLPIIEQVIRHLHSLSRTYAIPIAEAFRRHLGAWRERPGGEPSEGDLVVLTAIGSIYPTSDHFHQVVTPAVTLMGRWLAMNAPAFGSKKTLEERKSRVGAFMVGLCVKWQGLSKRYVPEAVRFTLRVLSAAAGDGGKVKVAEHLENLTTMADLWKDKKAFIEILAPFLSVLQNLGAPGNQTLQHLSTLLQPSHLSRQPLKLHTHRPQPLRTSNPKFEEGFNPDKHYDPDRERSEAAKLRKEVKREKKGAVRELRKDGAFVAREELRENRERDGEFVKRERRLVAEIAREGREGGGGGRGGRGKGRR
ncbi:hypothetical protein B0A55_00082 [Friedmanniomyces simplex]|uniref:Nop14-like protein n=1 Tax=Friedmanniomyces simplex TaxID=329884 RepID=A0A4U0Y651_9PEZI|nr:hypothetical protein B0A55_00082 [Friedmanniomyces simplex]